MLEWYQGLCKLIQTIGSVRGEHSLGDLGGEEKSPLETEKNCCRKLVLFSRAV